MSTILVGSELSYDVRKSTVLLLKISAAQTDHQKIVHEELTFAPQPSVEQLEVGLDGNRIYRTVFNRASGAFRIEQPSTCNLKSARRLKSPKRPKLKFRPTFCHIQTRERYCESDLLARFAFEEFGDMEFGHQRVQAICDWVHDFLDYTPGSTNSLTTASSVFVDAEWCLSRLCAPGHFALSRHRHSSSLCLWICGGSRSTRLPWFHGSFPRWQVVLIRPDQVSTAYRVGANWNWPRCRRCGLCHDHWRCSAHREIGVGLAIAGLAASQGG